MEEPSPEFSDFIVYADESGDHGIAKIDPKYPIFVLTFCVMRKKDYITRVVPAMQDFKFRFWGHDSVILHEREIRKQSEQSKQSRYFQFLRADQTRRERFFHCLNDLIATAPITVYASVIDKRRHQAQEAPWNPYEVALHFCMEQLWLKLDAEKQHGKRAHIVFERRGGKKEDKKLELQFRRIAANQSQWGSRQFDFRLFEFEPVFVSKEANSSGLQLADLTARPIGLSCLRPGQPNRAFEIIRPKLEAVKRFP